MIPTVRLGEAVALGVAFGPVCLASCGPVLVPSLLAHPGGVRPVTRSLSLFLGGRLAGYLVFAVAAWQLGSLVQLPPRLRVESTAAVDLLLAMALFWFAWPAGSRRNCACVAPQLVQIGGRPQRKAAAPAVLGLLTGLNLCPPFLAASVRAAQSDSLLQAMAFFAAFFLGTSVWFLPMAGIGCIARNDNLALVARTTMALIGLFYLASGIATWTGGMKHVY